MAYNKSAIMKAAWEEFHRIREEFRRARESSYCHLVKNPQPPRELFGDCLKRIWSRAKSQKEAAEFRAHMIAESGLTEEEWERQRILRLEFSEAGRRLHLCRDHCDFDYDGRHYHVHEWRKGHQRRAYVSDQTWELGYLDLEGEDHHISDDVPEEIIRLLFRAFCPQ